MARRPPERQRSRDVQYTASRNSGGWTLKICLIAGRQNCSIYVIKLSHLFRFSLPCYVRKKKKTLYSSPIMSRRAWLKTGLRSSFKKMSS